MKYILVISILIVMILVSVREWVFSEDAEKPPLTARVVRRDFGPSLEVNGKPVVPIGVVGTYTEAAQAVKNGVHIFNFQGPVFQSVNKDMSCGDIDFRQLVRMDSGALMIPRINVTDMPEWWIKEHPDDMLSYDNGQRRFPDLASRRYREDAAEILRVLIRNMEKNYDDNTLGYMPCALSSGEWFTWDLWDKTPGLEQPMAKGWMNWLKIKYKTESVLQKAWQEQSVSFKNLQLPSHQEMVLFQLGAFRNPKAQRKVIDFLEFYQETVADTIEHFARVIKEETGDRKLVAVFYGYLFHFAINLPTGAGATGHLALGRLLKSPDIDIIAAPMLYGDRQPGGSAPFMVPVDSVQLHGKLWLTEDDTRTYLSTDTVGRHGRTDTLEETEFVHQRNFAQNFTRNAGFWWMGLSGWSVKDTGPIWPNLGKLRNIYEASLPKRQSYHPEVVVIVDERSMMYFMPPKDTVPVSQYYATQPSLILETHRIGAPVGFYLLDDLCKGRVPDAKLYIFCNSFVLSNEERKALQNVIGRSGKVSLWFYAPGYIQGDNVSKENISSLIGMQVREFNKPIRLIVTPLKLYEKTRSLLSGFLHDKPFGAPALIQPTFYVEDSLATPLAYYQDSGKVAIAMKKQKEGRIFIYSGSYPGIEPKGSNGDGPSLGDKGFIYLIRFAAKLAGVHIFLDTDDIVLSGNSMLAIHAASSGEKHVKLPFKATVSDALTGEVLKEQTDIFDLNMKKGETRLLWLR